MEGHAGADQLNPTDANAVTEGVDQTTKTEAQEAPASATEASGTEASEAQAPDTEADASETSVDGSGDLTRTPGLRRSWLVLTAAMLVLVAGAVGVAGYLALRTHDANATTARADAAALAAAKECVAATHAPDATAMSASQMKIIDCATGSFGTQATLYSGVLVDAYQAANVKVQVSDLRAAVEKNNPDGSVDVLVAVRTKISNTDTPGVEQGYRLRVNMMPVDGTYKIAKLDQVSS